MSECLDECLRIEFPSPNMACLARNVLNLSRIPCTGLHRSFASVAPAGQGLNFNITDDQKELLDVAEKFTREEIIPSAAQYDKVGCFQRRFVSAKRF